MQTPVSCKKADLHFGLPRLPKSFLATGISIANTDAWGCCVAGVPAADIRRHAAGLTGAEFWLAYAAIFLHIFTTWTVTFLELYIDLDGMGNNKICCHAQTVLLLFGMMCFLVQVWFDMFL